MGQMYNAMKAAERAKAAEQESWATKEMEWAKEKANLLDTYEKCQQGLERAVRKLKEEKEKQATMKERQRAVWVKRKMKGRFPTASESGGESTQGPTPVAVERVTPKPARRMAAAGDPNQDGEPLGGVAGPGRRDLEARPRWREERWRRERGMEHRGRWEWTRGTLRTTEDRPQPEEWWVDRRRSSPDPRERGRW